MQITVKEVKFLKKGSNKNGPWELRKVIGEEGKEYTTFNTRVGRLMPGTVIDLDKVIIEDEDKRSFKEFAIVSEPAVPVAKGSDMSKEEWAEKDRITRQSMEARVAVSTIPALATARDKARAEDQAIINKALKWCEAKIDANMNGGIPNKTATKQEANPITDPSFGRQFENVGQFLKACSNAGVTRTEVLKHLKVAEEDVPKLNVEESWDIIYNDLIKPKKANE